jgi:hypothetical protein
VRFDGPQIPGVGVFDGTADILKAPIEPLCIRHIEEIWITLTEFLRRKNCLGLGQHMRQFLRPGEMTEACDAPLKDVRLNGFEIAYRFTHW